MHDPDLIIRTSGEQRLSNYLLWQSAYSELVLPRRAVAGLLARGFEARWPSSRRAGAASGAADGAPRRAPPRPPSRRRAPPSAAGATRSDLGARILVGDPGDRVRDLHRLRRRAGRSRSASLALGLICLHELFAMLDARAAGAARRASSARRRWSLRRALRRPVQRAARAGGAACRCCSCSRCASPGARGAITLAMAVTLLGVFWIGLALAHAVLLRELAARRRAHRRRARRHVHRRHRRLLRRARVRHAGRWRRAISPNKTVEGLLHRDGRPRSPRSGSPGLYQDWLSGADALLLGVGGGARGAARRPVRVADQARRRGQGHRRACSAPTAARWTAWTPCCSPCRSATTSGSR